MATPAPAAAAAAALAAQQASGPIVREFIQFLNAAVTPFHAVDQFKRLFGDAGYVRLAESDAWPPLEPGGKYFVTRNDSSIIAFTVGGKYVAGNGLKIAGTHTDSPNLALKPRSYSKKGGFLGVGVQLYGGGLWHTWFDRELTVAGRVVVQPEGKGHLHTALVHVRKPILRIPNLAIHLRPADERDKLQPNKEAHVAPVMATELMASAVAQTEKIADAQSGALFRLLAEQAGCKVEEIVDFDLSVVDTQPAALSGVFDEFICSARLDNLISCFCAAKALAAADASVAADDMIRMVAMFDNEEVGSESTTGAAGSLIPEIVERLNARDATKRAGAVNKSFLLSVDGAHCCHPNFMDKHEENHRPNLHEGPVIKYNANTRYATVGPTAAVVKALARLANVPVQQFVVRNDSPCGTTIGPVLSTLTGIKTADIGNAMLSMHSIREMCGTVDLKYMTDLLQTFFERYNEVSLVES